MKLYELSKEVAAIELKLNQYDEQGIEPPPDFIDEVNALTIEREEKIKSIGRLVKNLRQDLPGIDDEITRLKNMKRSVESKIDWLLKYLSYNVKPEEKFSDLTVSVSSRPSVAVNVFESGLLPSEYWRVKQEPDKELIKEALHGGIDVPGARLEHRRNIAIK